MSTYGVWVAPKGTIYPSEGPMVPEYEMVFVATVAADPNEIMSALDILFPDFDAVEIVKESDDSA